MIFWYEKASQQDWTVSKADTTLGVTELGGGNKETGAQASIHSDEEIIAPNTDSDVARPAAAAFYQTW